MSIDLSQTCSILITLGRPVSSSCFDGCRICLHSASALSMPWRIEKKKVQRTQKRRHHRGQSQTSWEQAVRIGTASLTTQVDPGPHQHFLSATRLCLSGSLSGSTMSTSSAVLGCGLAWLTSLPPCLEAVGSSAALLPVSRLACKRLWGVRRNGDGHAFAVLRSGHTPIQSQPLHCRGQCDV